VDQYGRSPLHVAAENGQLAAAMLFLNEQVWAAAHAAPRNCLGNANRSRPAARAVFAPARAWRPGDVTCKWLSLWRDHVFVARDPGVQPAEMASR